MKTKLIPAAATGLALLMTLLPATPALAFAGERGEKMELTGRFTPEGQRAQGPRFETHNWLPPERATVSRGYLHQRIDWLRTQDPRHFKMHAYFETLIVAGYDPVLLNTWLDGLYDGAILVGMPDELVLDCYGEPLFTNEVIFNGVPALERGIQVLPGRVEKVTVASGRVVRVRG
jgi:hypothetical protein